MLNIKQQQVYNWLNDTLNLPVFAEAYKGAVNSLNQKSAGYISFVAHAGRDLMNSLAATVAGIKSNRVQYQEHIDKLEDVWRDDWRDRDDLSPEAVEKGHRIPVEICQRVSTLIDEHKAGRMRSSDKDGLFFSIFLDYSDKDMIPTKFLSEWKTAKKWFLRHVHLREKPFQTETHNYLVKHFKCLDGYLQIAACSQYNRLKDLNEILDATNQ